MRWSILLGVGLSALLVGSLFFWCPFDSMNRLINEKSPYLLQHADNPVDWYPWGEEAFQHAPEATDTQSMLQALRRHFIPAKVVVFRPPEQGATITTIANYTQNQLPLKNGRATAYVCQNFTCRYPTTDPQKMLRYLGSKGKGEKLKN